MTVILSLLLAVLVLTFVDAAPTNGHVTVLQAKQSRPVSPFLQTEQLNQFQATINKGLEKVRQNVKEEFTQLEASTRAEKNLNNKLLTSILDSFFASLNENLNSLRAKYPKVERVQQELDSTKQIMLSELQNFDQQFDQQFTSQSRLILNSLINFHLSDFSLMFRVQKDFLAPFMVEKKVNSQFKALVTNLLDEHVITTKVLTGVIGRKIDYVLSNIVSFNVYLTTSLSFNMKNIVDYTRNEIVVNELFNDLVNKVQKLKIVTLLNFNNLFTKSYEKQQRLASIELLDMKETLYKDFIKSRRQSRPNPAPTATTLDLTSEAKKTEEQATKQLSARNDWNLDQEWTVSNTNQFVLPTGQPLAHKALQTPMSLWNPEWNRRIADTTPFVKNEWIKNTWGQDEAESAFAPQINEEIPTIFQEESELVNNEIATAPETIIETEIAESAPQETAAETVDELVAPSIEESNFFDESAPQQPLE